jgi:hypothetical protein
MDSFVGAGGVITFVARPADPALRGTPMVQ